MTNLVLSFIVWLNTYESLFAFIVLVLTIFSVVILPLCKLICAPKPNVKVSFEEGDSLTIYPEYIEEDIEEDEDEENVGMYGEYIRFKNNLHRKVVLQPKRDNRLCEVCIYVENIGKITLNDYRINVLFDKGTVEKLETDMIVDEEWEASVKTDSLELKSKVPLRKRETKDYSFDLMPSDGVTDIKAEWTFVSDHLKKSGELTIHVNPKYVNIQH